MSTSEINDVYSLLMLIGAVIFIIILTAFFCRWVFKIDQRIKNQEAIITLLTLQCKRQGITEEELGKA